jgi:DNA-binding winged helix-turn-helix (wHTH) protein
LTGCRFDGIRRREIQKRLARVRYNPSSDMQHKTEKTLVADQGFLLGQWLVQPSLGRISYEGNEVHLRPQLMDLLLTLVSSRGKVVSKVEILDTVWPGDYVSESALTRCMAELRSAFGDDAKAQAVIETIPKRGYRLIPEVHTLSEPTVTSPPSFDSPYRLAYGDRLIPIDEGETIIGRNPNATIRIDSIDVSRQHARIVIKDSLATIEDLGSKNGTFVAGKAVQGCVELLTGNKIIIGRTSLVFRIVGITGTTQTAGRE